MTTELRRVTFRTPICHICKKHVDKFEMVRHPNKEQTIKLIAYCHDDTSESEWLNEYDMDFQYTYKAFLDPRRTTVGGKKILTADPRDKNGFKWIN